MSGSGAQPRHAVSFDQAAGGDVRLSAQQGRLDCLARNELDVQIQAQFAGETLQDVVFQTDDLLALPPEKTGHLAPHHDQPPRLPNRQHVDHRHQRSPDRRLGNSDIRRGRQQVDCR